MELNHIGLNILNKNEVIDFYQNILGFHTEYRFDITEEIGTIVFGIKNPAKVILCRKKNLLLELLIRPEILNQGFAHICLGVKNRENIADKCNKSGYPVIRIKRSDKQDILFIKDKTGNLFELKNDMNEDLS
ncbi:MAG: VOC family protein [Bacteroidales bacterium]|nr:VOC family protein [Bacteroidales bacterium]